MPHEPPVQPKYDFEFDVVNANVRIGGWVRRNPDNAKEVMWPHPNLARRIERYLRKNCPNVMHEACGTILAKDGGYEILMGWPTVSLTKGGNDAAQEG